jgi:hypothetical protein
MTPHPDPTSRFGNWISEGWKMFTSQWQMWVLLSLGSLFVVALPIAGFTALIVMMVFASAAAGAADLAAFPIILVTLLVVLLILPLSVFLTGGMYRSAFKQMRGGKLEFRDLFSAGDVFLPLLGATIVMAILQMIGAMLCVIPAFIVAGLLLFTAPLIVDRRMAMADALRTSYEFAKQKWLLFTLFALLVQLIVSAGTYVCYVGILATYPLMFTMIASAYKDCFGLQGERDLLSTPHHSSMSYLSEPPSAVAPPPMPSSPNCVVCNAPLPGTATFCPRCGARVG